MRPPGSSLPGTAISWIVRSNSQESQSAAASYSRDGAVSPQHVMSAARVVVLARSYRQCESVVPGLCAAAGWGGRGL